MKRALLFAAALVATVLAVSGSASAACVFPYCPAPSVQTGTATNVTPTSAVLTGVVNGNGAGETSYYFADGSLTTTFGTGSLPDSTAAFPVSMTLTGLTPGTTYSYRVGATNLGGSVPGNVVTFTTPTTAASGTGTEGGPGGTSEASTAPRVDPNRVSISAEPRRDRRRPFRYTITGGVEVSDGSLCSSGGDVLVLFGRGRLIASQMVTLEADCGYQATVTVPASELNRRSGRINVRAKFRGNAQLNNAESQTIRVRFG
jgi:hypothetical protein